MGKTLKEGYKIRGCGIHTHIWRVYVDTRFRGISIVRPNLLL